jgi:tetratricopeptide (TPR) repeat protein
MIVEEMERQFFELKGKLDVGVVTEEEFKALVQKLRFQDKQGRWWMLGAQSGKWYSYDGARWIPGQPPTDAPSSAAPVAAPPSVPSLSETAAPSQLETLTPPTPIAAPPQPEHLAVAPRARPVPPPPPVSRPSVSGPIVIAGAAFVALIVVVVLWLLLDNLVPNKPISGFFGGLIGNPPATTRAPTAVAGAPNIATLLAQGDQFLAQSQMDVAIAQYQNAAQLAPTNAAPLVRWSRALAFKGGMTDALSKAQQAIQRAPNDADAQAQLCRALAWNGQVDDAITAGEKAVQIDTRNVSARANLAEAYLLKQGRMVDAQAAANAAVQLAPSSAEAHRAQAWGYTIQGQKENALNEWKQTVTLEPNFYFRHFEYGEVLRLYFNVPADAVPEYQKAVALYGAYIPAINRLGLSLLAVNKPQDAVAPFQRALTLDARNAEAYANLGLAFGMANQCAQAIPYFEQALRLDANNSAAQRGLADCKAGKAPTLLPATPPQVPLTPPTVTPK